jgi:hypothetical protein
MEPNLDLHNIYDTYEEALVAYQELTEEEQEIIYPPRQSHLYWIIDKINE